MKRIAFFGKLADSPNTGDRGSSATQPAYVVTPLQGLRAAVGESLIAYDDGGDIERAVLTSKSADAAVCVVGLIWIDEGDTCRRAALVRTRLIFRSPQLMTYRSQLP